MLLHLHTRYSLSKVVELMCLPLTALVVLLGSNSRGCGDVESAASKSIVTSADREDGVTA